MIIDLHTIFFYLISNAFDVILFSDIQLLNLFVYALTPLFILGMIGEIVYEC